MVFGPPTVAISQVAKWIMKFLEVRIAIDAVMSRQNEFMHLQQAYCIKTLSNSGPKTTHHEAFQPKPGLES